MWVGKRWFGILVILGGVFTAAVLANADVHSIRQNDETNVIRTYQCRAQLTPVWLVDTQAVRSSELESRFSITLAEGEIDASHCINASDWITVAGEQAGSAPAGLLEKYCATVLASEGQFILSIEHTDRDQLLTTRSVRKHDFMALTFVPDTLANEVEFSRVKTTQAVAAQATQSVLFKVDCKQGQ